MKNTKFTIITFYQFKKNKKIERIQKLLKEFCLFNKIKGTIILAEEGINGTVAGLNEPINNFKKILNKLEYIKLEQKISLYDFMPFNRLKIKIKKEIVTFDEKNLDVEKLTGRHINSFEWNNLIKNKETILIDVRNNFEFEIGSFKGAVSPNTKNFTEFKKYLNKDLVNHKNEKIATVPPIA